MVTLVQWIHLTAAVVGIGGMGFLLLVLFPSSRLLATEQRDQLFKAVMGRFRWVSWSVVALLLASGLYNIRHFYWEVRWGLAWKMLTLKIVLAFLVFAISLCLTLPFSWLQRFRARRATWLSIAFALGIAVIAISAYLRRG